MSTSHLPRKTPEAQLCKTFRNSITFTKHRRPGSVTFIDNFSFFIACVNVDTRKMRPEELVEHCQAVRSELFAAVEAGLKNTHHKNSRPAPAFLCPIQNESCSTELHTAHLSENGQKWICSVNYDNFDYLSSNQKTWGLSGDGKLNNYYEKVVFKISLFLSRSSYYSFKDLRLTHHAAAA